MGGAFSSNEKSVHADIDYNIGSVGEYFCCGGWA